MHNRIGDAIGSSALVLVLFLIVWVLAIAPAVQAAAG